MSIKENFALMTIFVLISVVLGGCISSPELAEGPVYFVNVDSGESIAPILIIPNYGTFSGISTKGGHDPKASKGKNGILLANPFIYYSDGTPFEVKQPSSTGVIIPSFMAGIMHKGISLHGVDVYAKGYKVDNVAFRFLIKPRPQTFKLEPVGKDESEREFSRISEGLRNNNFKVLLTYPFIREDTALEFDFSKKEIKMMEDFFNADTK